MHVQRVDSRCEIRLYFVGLLFRFFRLFLGSQIPEKVDLAQSAILSKLKGMMASELRVQAALIDSPQQDAGDKIAASCDMMLKACLPSTQQLGIAQFASPTEHSQCTSGSRT